METETKWNNQIRSRSFHPHNRLQQTPSWMTAARRYRWAEKNPSMIWLSRELMMGPLKQPTQISKETSPRSFPPSNRILKITFRIKSRFIFRTLNLKIFLVQKGFVLNKKLNQKTVWVDNRFNKAIKEQFIFLLISSLETFWAFSFDKRFSSS